MEKDNGKEGQKYKSENIVSKKAQKLLEGCVVGPIEKTGKNERGNGCGQRK